MHSGSTAHHASPPDAATPTSPPAVVAIGRRPVGLLTVVAAVALLLSGCASDRATDQNHARETAQTTPGLIIGDQATYTANRYASPTVSPTATAPPPATVKEIGLATGVDGSGQPNGFYTAVPANAGTVYLVADLDGLMAGSEVASDWLSNQKKPTDRKDYGGSSFTVTQDGRQWVALPMTLDGSLPTGEYGLYLFVDGQQIATLGIQITDSGSAPRSV